MSAESQAVDPYEAVLADLRAKREQIDQAIQLIEALRGGAAPKPAHVSHSDAGITSPGAFLGMTVVDATKRLLASRRKALPTAEIVSALEDGGLVMNSKDKLNTVGSILMRRFNTNGDIVRVSRGVWGLQEWYGSRFKKKPKDTAEPEPTVTAETIEDRLGLYEAEAPVNRRPITLEEHEDIWGPIDGPVGGRR